MKIKIIGAGGIGSYTIEYLDKLVHTNQINARIECYDDDIVELKNILYQNFNSDDIDEYKTEALSYKYVNINYNNIRLGLNDLQDCDLIVLCADNNIIRRNAYENYKTNKIQFIDARSNGKTVGIYSSNTKNYLLTIDKTDESSSCQHPYQIEKNEIELGNIIIASILSQAILSWCRTQKLPLDYMHNF